VPSWHRQEKTVLPSILPLAFKPVFLSYRPALLFALLANTNFSPYLDISGQAFAAFRVLKSYTVSWLVFTLVNDFLEKPNQVTMTAGVEVQVLSPIQDYFSVSPSCYLYNRKKCFSVEAVKAEGGGGVKV